MTNRDSRGELRYVEVKAIRLTSILWIDKIIESEGGQKIRASAELSTSDKDLVKGSILKYKDDTRYRIEMIKKGMSGSKKIIISEVK